MTRVFRICLGICVAAVAFAAAARPAPAAADIVKQDLTLFIGEQQTFTPGYPMGDVQVLNPDVANFSKIVEPRRELMLVGKAKGETTVIIWDQKHVKRHELHIIVRSRDDMKQESDLKDLLKDFPTVQVRRLGEQLVVSGTVSTQSDFDAIGRIANVANAQNLVRIVRSGTSGGAVTATPTTPDATPTTTTTTSSGPAVPAAAPMVEYEVEVIEANIAFMSGTYGKGIEPSGRTLYKQTVKAAVGSDAEVLVPGTAVSKVDPGKNDKDKKNDKNKNSTANSSGAAQPGATSLHMRLRPTGISEDGQLTTFVVIDTNLPVEGSMDPSVNRRARWELVGATDEPFGLGGAELMAMPQVAQFPSRLGRVLGTASQVSGLPGVSGRAGTNYVPSYVPYYDKSKNTQLLAVFRPRLVQASK
jgi:hypothetical protein